MRLFVSEFFSSGGWSGEEDGGSLLREGKAMLLAIVADFARIDDCRIATTWNGRLGPFPLDGVEVTVVSSPQEERHRFQQLAADCESAFVIAPEFDGLLIERRRLVDAAGARFVGPSPQALELCTDKYLLTDHLRRHGLPTIETVAFDPESSGQKEPFPLVLKPRDGAGSLNTFLVSNRNELDAARKTFAATAPEAQIICQPYLPGMAISIGTICSPSRGPLEIFPVATQRLSRDGRFRYLGGRIPAPCFATRRIEHLVRRACECIPGLAGYVGFDLILPRDAASPPLICEVNPRLTTSYLGYRALTTANLAERILFSDRHHAAVEWQPHAVEFLPDGTVTNL